MTSAPMAAPLVSPVDAGALEAQGEQEEEKEEPLVLSADSATYASQLRVCVLAMYGLGVFTVLVDWRWLFGAIFEVALGLAGTLLLRHDSMFEGLLKRLPQSIPVPAWYSLQGGTFPLASFIAMCALGSFVSLAHTVLFGTASASDASMLGPFLSLVNTILLGIAALLSLSLLQTLWRRPPQRGRGPGYAEADLARRRVQCADATQAQRAERPSGARRPHEGPRDAAEEERMLREAMAASRVGGQGLQPFVQPFERGQREAVQGMSGTERMRALGITPPVAGAGQRLSGGDPEQPAQAQARALASPAPRDPPSAEDQPRGQRLGDDEQQHPPAQGEAQAQGSRSGSRSGVGVAGSTATEEAPVALAALAAQAAPAEGDAPRAEESAAHNQRSGEPDAESAAAQASGAAPSASSAAAPAAAAAAAPVAAEEEAEDRPEPSAKVDCQLRLPNGQKVRQQFSESDRVSKVYAFVDNRCPDLNGVSFSLTTAHPRRILDDLEQRLVDAGVTKQCVIHVEKH